jgi:hypothetical protein
VYGS